MNRIEQVESQVKKLSPDELRVFGDWFEQLDAELWDRQIEADAKSGKLQDLADRVLQGHKAGRSILISGLWRSR
jgi:hypothetical protein